MCALLLCGVTIMLLSMLVFVYAPELLAKTPVNKLHEHGVCL